jgi:hypothetical protein
VIQITDGISLSRHSSNNPDREQAMTITILNKIERALTRPLFGETSAQKIVRQHNMVLLNGTENWILCDEGYEPIAEFNTDCDAVKWINKHLEGR